MRLILGEADIAKMISLRKEGNTLKAIGVAYRMTRERTRQILEREILRGNWDGKINDKEIDIFPPGVDARIREMVGTGETVARMSALLGIERGKIRNRMFVLDLRENNIRTKRPDKTEFRELYLAGKSHSYLSSYFGISFGSISRWVDAFDLPRRFGPAFSKINGTKMLDALTIIGAIDPCSEQGKVALRTLADIRTPPATVIPGEALATKEGAP